MGAVARSYRVHRKGTAVSDLTAEVLCDTDCSTAVFASPKVLWYVVAPPRSGERIAMNWSSEICWTQPTTRGNAPVPTVGMSEIIRAGTGRSKPPLIVEVALESGRLALVPSHVGLRGPMSEYSVVMSPEAPTTYCVQVTPTDAMGPDVKVDKVVVTPTKKPKEGMVCLRVAVSHLVVSDVASLYCAGHGVWWRRPGEAGRAIHACKGRKTGGSFDTDYGETAVAVKLGKGPLRAIAALQAGRLEIRVLPPVEEDE